jgi:hypothetical protein
MWRTSPSAAPVKSAFPQLVARSAADHDVQVARRLWDASEHLTGVRFPLGAPTGARL